MLLKVLEITGFAVVGIIIATQLVLPLWRGQKTFPMLRRQWKLESELASLTQDAEESRLQTQINALKEGNQNVDDKKDSAAVDRGPDSGVGAVGNRKHVGKPRRKSDNGGAGAA